LAFYLLNGLGQQAITLAQSQKAKQHLPLTSNLLLLESFTKQKLETEPLQLPTATRLRPEIFASFYHGVLRDRIPADKKTLSRINSYLNSEENNAYHLDLKILQSYVQQRLNQTLAARTTLENLAGTEETYSDYLLDLIGLQLMQQRLYAAAATHFEQAQAKGLPDAPLHYLYALAFLPNKSTEALLLASELAESENPVMAAQANQLLFLLQANPTQVILQKSDSAKVQYLQLNQQPNSLTDQDFVAIAGSVNNPELKNIAQKELTAYYLNNRNWPAAMQVLQGLLPRLTQKNQLLSEVNILQAELMLQTNQLPQLAQALSRMYLQGPNQNLKYYYQAVLTERNQKIAAAAKQYNLAVTALPYHTPTVLAAANFFNTKAKQKNQAYDILLNSITYNPHEAEVYKAYILQSVEIGYGGFAETALQELSTLISAAEMASFELAYKAKVAERQAALGLEAQ